MAPGMMDPSQVMPDAYGDAGRRSQQINLTGMPPEAAQKLMQMQNQLAKAALPTTVEQLQDGARKSESREKIQNFGGKIFQPMTMKISNILGQNQI